MPLQFDINIAPTKNFRQTFNRALRLFDPTMSQSDSQGAVIAASEAYEPGSVFSQFFFVNRPIFFPRRTQLHFGDQAAEVLVAGARGNKKRKTERISDFQFSISDFWS